MVVFQAATDGGPVLEPGTYVLEVDRFEDAGVGQFGPQIKWMYRVSDPTTPDEPIRGSDGEPYLLFQWSSPKPTPRSKCRPWIEALYGRPLAKGEQPQEKHLVGRRMRALVVHVTDGNGNTHARISGEIAPKPYPRRGEQAVEPVPEPSAAEAPDAQKEARRRQILGDDAE
jgi:hypothetical protein